MESIGFFTPYQFEKKNKSCYESALEKVTDYFYLSGKKISILSCKGHRLEATLVDGSQSCDLTYLKIVSYLTIVIPILMFLAKLILTACLLPNALREKGLTPAEGILAAPVQAVAIVTLGTIPAVAVVKSVTPEPVKSETAPLQLPVEEILKAVVPEPETAPSELVAEVVESSKVEVLIPSTLLESIETTRQVPAKVEKKVGSLKGLVAKLIKAKKARDAEIFALPPPALILKKSFGETFLEKIKIMPTLYQLVQDYGIKSYEPREFQDAHIRVLTKDLGMAKIDVIDDKSFRQRTVKVQSSVAIFKKCCDRIGLNDVFTFSDTETVDETCQRFACFFRSGFFDGVALYKNGKYVLCPLYGKTETEEFLGYTPKEITKQFPDAILVNVPKEFKPIGFILKTSFPRILDNVVNDVQRKVLDNTVLCLAQVWKSQDA